METKTKTPKTAKNNKKTDIAKEVNSNVHPAQNNEPEINGNVTKVTSQNKPVKQLGTYQTVTSLGLRRKIVPDPCKRVALFVSDEEYTELNLIGIKLGVTWDEVVRASISQAMASNDPAGSLRNFILL
jgi:hypothetical protein